MRIPGEWASVYGLSMTAEQFAALVRAIQANTLDSAKESIVAALQGDYYLEQAERIVSSTIDRLKPAAPASPEAVPPK